MIKHGFVGKLNTPIIRVKNKKGKITQEFYYEEEYKRWLEEGGKGRAVYYKGLDCHDTGEEINGIARHFTSLIYTITLEDTDKELFDIYFGKDASKRKEVLVSPVNFLTYDEAKQLFESKMLPCRIHLNVDTKAYKLEAIRRQIPHIMDGLNPSRRKTVCEALKLWHNGGNEKKVFQFGGLIASDMFYHHGDASLNKTIINMAQNFVNARSYPYLLGFGGFGSRAENGKDSGAPRYTSVKLNPLTKLIFPDRDKYLLQYTFEEGERAEPLYYVPVIPMSILESFQIPSEAWKHKSFGRNLDEVITYLKERIGGSEKSDYEFSVDNKRYKGRIELYKGSLHSFGLYKYKRSSNTIIVSELPIGLPNCKFVEDCKKKSVLVDDVNDYSDEDNVHIIVELKDGAIDKIKDNGNDVMDGIEFTFKMYSSLKPNLNYFYEKGILELNKYKQAFEIWFEERLKLYDMRLTRENVILRYQIMELENVIKFIEANMDLSQESEDNVDEVLHGYDKINTSLLHDVKYTNNEELERNLIGSDASYDYLLNIREREKFSGNLDKKKAKLEELRNQLKETEEGLNERPIKGASIWLREIDELKTYIDEHFDNWK
ncbi:DNA topoisomerase 4 subunit A [uncultured archaeon]|nr:DNA topoisomerase 4 subunit A [uncultured archaeon]